MKKQIKKPQLKAKAKGKGGKPQKMTELNLGMMPGKKHGKKH